MYKYKKARRTSIKRVSTNDGESIEMKVRRITENKEPIKDGAPEIFTERKEGVKAGYNIRSDRWEIATDAMDSIHRNKVAKGESKPNLKIVKDIEEGIIEEGKDGGAEPIQGTK